MRRGTFDADGRRYHGSKIADWRNDADGSPLNRMILALFSTILALRYTY